MGNSDKHLQTQLIQVNRRLDPLAESEDFPHPAAEIAAESGNAEAFDLLSVYSDPLKARE